MPGILIAGMIDAILFYLYIGLQVSPSVLYIKIKAVSPGQVLLQDELAASKGVPYRPHHFPQLPY